MQLDKNKFSHQNNRTHCVSATQCNNSDCKSTRSVTMLSDLHEALLNKTQRAADLTCVFMLSEQIWSDDYRLTGHQRLRDSKRICGWNSLWPDYCFKLISIRLFLCVLSFHWDVPPIILHEANVKVFFLHVLRLVFNSPALFPLKSCPAAKFWPKN